ncbi:MAG: alpha/beta fold hydrolase [Tepidiformaceae bacterium]
MPYIDLSGMRMFYSDEGSGPPVVLVHGFTCDGNDWAWQIPALAASHRVITVDLRGHGRSSAPESGYEPKQFAADIAELLGKLQIGPVVAMGHSLGGTIVSVLAVEYPELVRAIVPVDPAYGLPEELRELVTPLMAAFAGPQAHAAAKEFFANRFYPPASPAHLRTWHARRIEGVPHHVLAPSFRGIFEGEGQVGMGPRSLDYMRRRACPVLAFYAEPARAAVEASLAKHPYSRAVGWEGSGHFLHQERPAEFNDILTAWLAGLP